VARGRKSAYPGIMSNRSTHAAGSTVRYGFHSTPFGEALLAISAQGICALSFVDDGGRAEALASVGRRWPSAALVEDDEGTRGMMASIFSRASGADSEIRVDAKGTDFQRMVWDALRELPRGSVTTYQDIARRIGKPGAARAVGSAIGRNPVAFVIPCHRVIRKSGDLGGYRWGLDRKRRILSWEGQRG
jgi:AraC family transcriptional regulator, regulatory protein of adaptative response / methylated-DNA-[protein]-cysteine methyltransferase